MRWTPDKKRELIESVNNGTADLDLVCKKHNMSIEEFVTMQKRYEKHGKRGLRTTRRYRE